jgi:putative flippase GtrA
MLFENVFHKRYVAYMSAMILGQIIATVNAFIFHKYITFKSEVKGKGIIGEFFRFCLTYVVTFVLSLLLLPFFVEIIHFHPRIAGVLVIPICAVVNYLGHSRFSFGI